MKLENSPSPIISLKSVYFSSVGELFHQSQPTVHYVMIGVGKLEKFENKPPFFFYIFKHKR